MASRSERNEIRGRDEIRGEIESVLRTYGITAGPERSQLNASDFAHLKEVALRLIRGYVDESEISDLSDDAIAELPIMMQSLILLRNSPTVRDLEASNPYYTVFQPSVVRDGAVSVD